MRAEISVIHDWRFVLLTGMALSGLLASPPTAASGLLPTMKPNGSDSAPEPARLPASKPHLNAAAGLKMIYSGRPIDVTTFHYDTMRTGWNQSETDLTTASVASAKFGLLKTIAVDGNVLAQPLLVSGFIMPDGSKHDVLLVATGHNTLYALDAQSCAVLWQVSLGTPQATNDVGCTDLIPEYGITATPVIVRQAANAATIYVIAATEPSPYVFHSMLHAISLGTGADLQAPVEIAPSVTQTGGGTVAYDPQTQWSRAGLAYSKGSLYVSVGSHCDAGSGTTSGWLLRYDNSLALRHAFNTIDNPASFELASVWMTGFAPAIDEAGRVFVVTGNGNYNGDRKGGRDWGESVLELPSSLARVVDHFTPDDYATLNSQDADFGSGGIVLLPTLAGQAAPPLAVAGGKNPALFLLNRTKLGGRQTGDAGALQSISNVCCLLGGSAYYGGSSTPYVYYQGGVGEVLQGYALSRASLPSLTPTLAGIVPGGHGGTMPIVSSNGAAPGTGVVWILHRGTSIVLEAYDANQLGRPIFTSNAGTWSNSNGNPYISPIEANGRVYVPATQTVTVFGLTP